MYRRPGPPPLPLGRIMAGALLILLVAAGIWFLVYPDHLAEIIGIVRPVEPVVAGLNVAVDGTARQVKPGGFLNLNPRDMVTIKGFESNRWRNHGLRLYSPDLDVDLLGRPTSLLTILGEDAFAEPRQIVVQIKEGPRVVADFYFLAGLGVLDWLTKAERASAWEDKARYYRLALKTDPKDHRLREKLAQALENGGDLAGAAEIHEKIQSEKPDPRNLEKLLTLYRTAGNRARQIETIEKLITSAPPEKAREYLQDLADLYKTAGDQAHLLAAWRRLLTTDPEDVARTRLGEIADIQESQGDVAGAVKTLTALVDRLASTDRAGVLKKIGLLHAKNKDWAQAITAFEAAAQLDPQDPNNFFNLSRLYQAQGQPTKYAENLAKALRLAPGNQESRWQLIEAWIETGNRDRAEEELKKILSATPDDTRARLLLIRLLEEKGDRAALVPHYEYLIGQEPGNKVLYYNLGVIYFESNDLDKAARRMKEVTRLDADDLAAHQYLLVIQQKLGRPAEAVAEAQELLRLKPDREQLIGYVIDYFESQKDWVGMVRFLDQMLKAKPDNLNFLERRAEALIKTGNPREAAKAWTDLAGRKGNDVPTLMRAAGLHEQAGDWTEARLAYDRILELDPKNTKAAEARLSIVMKGLEKKQK